MLLTPQWKKAVIPKIIEKIFLNYNNDIYIQKLCNLVRDVTRLQNDGTTYLSIKWKDTFYTAFATSQNNPFKAFSIYPTHPYFNRFIEIIDERAAYKKMTSDATNYLSVGLAMCHTLECVSAVFPESILNILNKIVTSGRFFPLNTTTPKQLAFIAKNEKFVIELEKQLVMNLIVPDLSNAENQF